MNYADRQLSDLALSVPMVTEIFRKNRLDFCCGGKQTLKEACEKKSVNLASIIEELKKLEGKSSPTNETRPLNELTAFIVERYHNDLRRRIPELMFLAEKVEKVHADHDTCPHGLHDVLKNLYEEMLMHMMKEENVLFPLINSGRGNMAQMPVKVMTSEHDLHGKELEKIHELTSSFTPPAHACTTWRSLYKGLEKLEAELMEHIHLENNILFPRALAQTGI